MGGNAFPNLTVDRVNRQDIKATMQDVVTRMNFPNLTLEYLENNLLGSAGKQPTSGDLDFAMNDRPAVFVGEENLPVFDLRQLAARAREVLPEGHVSTRTLRGGTFNTAWPVAGDFSNGLVQVDFMAGEPKWLKFSHYSPGLDRSGFKGVAISTMWGVLAKMRKDFEMFEDGSFNLGPVPNHCKPYGEPMRTARVGLAYDLEKGLRRKWEVSLRKGQGPASVDPDVFETKVSQAPRFTRLGYVTDPDTVLTILFGCETRESDVTTFEEVVARIKAVMPSRYEEARERFLEAFSRSSGANGHNVEETANHPVWE